MSGLGTKRTSCARPERTGLTQLRHCATGLRRNAARLASIEVTELCATLFKPCARGCDICPDVDQFARTSPCCGVADTREDSNAASSKRPHHYVRVLLARPDRRGAIRERGSHPNRVHVEATVRHVSCGRLCDLARQDP